PGTGRRAAPLLSPVGVRAKGTLDGSGPPEPPGGGGPGEEAGGGCVALASERDMSARAGLPAVVRGSEALYRRLLGLYPSNHRREFGFWMEQVFRDLCRQAYRREGGRGLAKVWLRTFPDLA